MALLLTVHLLTRMRVRVPVRGVRQQRGEQVVPPVDDRRQLVVQAVGRRA